MLMSDHDVLALNTTLPGEDDADILAFARKVEAAVLAAASQALQAQAETKGGLMDDEGYALAVRHCASAVRDLGL